MLDAIASELSAYGLIELAAVLLAVVYLILAAQNIRYCWIAAFFSSLLFVVILWRARLLMDVALNLYYVAMAVYGWFCWAESKSSPQSISIHSRDRVFHAKTIIAIITLSLLTGRLLSVYTEADFPYLDSLTTWGSLLATWMLARRLIENWLYWIVFDTIAIYLYYSKGLHFTMMLFIFYTAMSVYAYANWRSLQAKSTQQTVAG